MICPKCGNSLREDMFCENCKEYLFNMDKPKKGDAVKSWLKVFGITIGCFAVFIGIVIGIVEIGEKQAYNNEEIYQEYSEDEQTDNANKTDKNNLTQNHSNIIDNGVAYFNIGHEELISRYNNNIKNDPENANASYSDIAFCSFDSYESTSYSYKHGNATIYTYFSSYEDNIKDHMGSTIMVDNDTDDVIWAEIYAREEFLDSASTGKIIQNMFWYLSNAVFPKMSKTEFNGIWYEIASASNTQTEYNDFVFMVEVVDGAYHFIITKKGIID